MNLAVRYTLMLILSAIAGGLSSSMFTQLIPRGMIFGVLLTLGLIVLNRISAARYARGEPPQLGTAMICGAVSGTIAGLIIMIYGTGGPIVAEMRPSDEWFSPGITMVASITAGFLFHTAYAQRFVWTEPRIRSCYTVGAMILAGFLQSLIRIMITGAIDLPSSLFLMLYAFIMISCFTGVLFAILWYLSVVFLDPSDGMVQRARIAKAPPLSMPGDGEGGQDCEEMNP